VSNASYFVHENYFNNSEVMKSSELPILHYIIQRSGKQYNKKTACRDL
jgi:hypothetical protein